jgi:hypothetical protein
MRLKKMIAIVLCSSLSVVAFAHPGRTDSQGGHYNHSTGEYHYHHGYSEHQHSDRDGDGTLDCPYRIIGSLGSSSGSSSSSSKSGTITKKKTDSSEKSTSSSKKEKKSLPDIAIYAIAIAVVFGPGFVVDFVKDAIQRGKEKKKRD